MGRDESHGGRRLRSLPRIPTALFCLPVSGWNLSGGTLRDELGDDATLLVFLRHFG